MHSVYNDIASALNQNRSIVVVTVFSKSGSAPREEGAKMMVREDGTITGTIGGGKLEAEAIKGALELFKTGGSVIAPFNLTGADAADMNMICGGSGELFLDYISVDDPVNPEIYNSILEVRKKREKAWLITGIGTGSNSNRRKQQCLIKQDHTMIGEFETDREFLAKLINGPAKITIHSEARDGQRILVESIRNASTVYIFGAGHVSQKVVPIAESVGFNTVVIDDRSDFANRERFPTSEIVLLKTFNDPLPEFPYDDDCFIVIVTRGHMYDKTVLAQVMRKPVQYLGMIGSRSKRDLLYKTLAAEKGFRDEEFARIHSPIGLDIKAESPEEIAVSIVAELIQVRAENGRCADRIK